MNNETIIVLGLLVISGILTFMLGFICYTEKKQLKLDEKALELNEYEIKLNCNVEFEKIIEFLDRYLEGIFAEYLLFNIEFQEPAYIDAELEITIAKESALRALERISPDMLDRVALIYKRDKITTVVSEKMYFHTMNYVMTKNKPKENVKK